MKQFRLVRAEWYRFWHSMDLIKYLLMIAPALAAIGYFSSGSYIETAGKDAWAQEIWRASLPNLFSVILLAVVITVAYIGREYRAKTICYELMQGYPIGAIALSKILTCGVICGALVTGSMLLVNGFVPGALAAAGGFRILLLYLFFFHLFSVSALLVMLFRNGLTGGIAAFFRFLFLDGILLSVFRLTEKKSRLLLFDLRWERLLDVSAPIPVFDGMMMFAATFAEILLFVIILKLIRPRVDY